MVSSPIQQGEGIQGFRWITALLTGDPYGNWSSLPQAWSRVSSLVGIPLPSPASQMGVGRLGFLPRFLGAGPLIFGGSL